MEVSTGKGERKTRARGGGKKTYGGPGGKNGPALQKRAKKSLHAEKRGVRGALMGISQKGMFQVQKKKRNLRATKTQGRSSQNEDEKLDPQDYNGHGVLERTASSNSRGGGKTLFFPQVSEKTTREKEEEMGT